MERDVIIDMEQDTDGVYKAKSVTRSRKKAQEVRAMPDVSFHKFIPTTEDSPINELAYGFEAGMEIFSRIMKAARKR